MSTIQPEPGDLLFDPDAVTLSAGSLIGNAYVQGEGAEYDIVRPSDGKVVRSERGATADQVDRAVRAARRSHATGVWADATARQRAQVFRRWADLVEANAREIVGIESQVSTRLATEVATLQGGSRPQPTGCLPDLGASRDAGREVARRESPRRRH